jgi:hypothetical protein
MRLVVILISTAIVLFLSVQAFKKEGPSSPTVSTAIAQGSAAVVDTNLMGAKSILDLQFTSAGTYAGAQVASAGVALMRADATGYCIQGTDHALTQHLDGPGGAPAPGPC